MLDTVKSKDWNEIYDVEDEYIIKFDSKQWVQYTNNKQYSHIIYSDGSRR